MGCDFYTYYKVCIECKDKEVTEHILEDTRERHYWYEDFPEMDSDFEEADDYRKRYSKCIDRQIEGMLTKYSKKDLYRDGKWLCVPAAVEKYQNILTELKIVESEVVHVWKQGGAHLR
jgi:hypothetical protein